ncbi:MAG: NADH-quinone oxidoreductase subunit H [Deltaproteobacteria bacterium]|nr:NADH-quinone oxidoreductase subunit H [Deltaproteobacteria bacterium]
MIEAMIALLWLSLIIGAVGAHGWVERRARLARVAHRGDLLPPRRAWGGEPDRPPASWVAVRMLATGARIVRSQTRVVGRSASLRRLSRLASLLALASAFALLPFAGTWGGAPEARALVVLDLESGLLALVFLAFLFGLAQVLLGLSDRSEWSRIASVRVAGRGLVGLALLVLVLAALTVETGSLRIHDLVLAQRESFAPALWLARLAVGLGLAPDTSESLQRLGALQLPAWLILRQPLTAILFVPAAAMCLRGAPALDTRVGSFGVTGVGLDDDPLEQQQDRLHARLSGVLGAALFVVFFLGAGSIPGLAPERVVTALEPFVGRVIPSLGMVLAESSAFFAKLVLVVALASRIRSASAALRGDQWMQETLRRLVPLAWANLLLLAALWQLGLRWEGGN